MIVIGFIEKPESDASRNIIHAITKNTGVTVRAFGKAHLMSLNVNIFSVQGCRAFNAPVFDWVKTLFLFIDFFSKVIHLVKYKFSLLRGATSNQKNLKTKQVLLMILKISTLEGCGLRSILQTGLFLPKIALLSGQEGRLMKPLRYIPASPGHGDLYPPCSV